MKHTQFESTKDDEQAQTFEQTSMQRKMQTVASFWIILVRSKAFTHVRPSFPTRLYLFPDDCLSAPSFTALPAGVFMEP